MRELANRLGATGCHYLHAPAVLFSPQARDALLTESSVAATLDAARQADVAFVGNGSPGPRLFGTGTRDGVRTS